MVFINNGPQGYKRVRKKKKTQPFIQTPMVGKKKLQRESYIVETLGKKNTERNTILDFNDARIQTFRILKFGCNS